MRSLFAAAFLALAVSGSAWQGGASREGTVQGADGVTLFYRQAGSGAPAILPHGGPGSNMNGVWQPSTLDWDAAERNIVRLKPDAFPSLPAAVRAYLTKRSCTIPQSPEVDEQPNNVIRGRFTSATQQDIAVLCSVKGMSTILVFRGGSVSGVAALAAMEDKGFLQTTGGNTIGFSRAIGVATPPDIRAYHKAFGGPVAPRIVDHDGIDDAFVGKASIVRYWHGGKWLDLTGMD